jgi:hypothetical protein
MGRQKREQKKKHQAVKKSLQQTSIEEQVLYYAFGNPEAQKDFSRRHQAFIKLYPKIRDLQDKAVAGTRMETMDDKVLYFLARQVFEDFDEILLLCGNGYSTGALKILRGMFERAVTACYLQKFPEEIDAYHKFFYIRQRKETLIIKEVYPNATSDEKMKEIEAEYKEVKPMFQIPVCEVCKYEECKPCKKTSDNFSWNRKGIVQLARDGGHFDSVIYVGYYVPMHETHSTERAMVNRVQSTGEHTWRYIEGAKPEMDTKTLLVAHYLLIRALDVLDNRFNIGMEDAISEGWEDYKKIWLENRRVRKQ